MQVFGQLFVKNCIHYFQLFSKAVFIVHSYFFAGRSYNYLFVPVGGIKLVRI